MGWDGPSVFLLFPEECQLFLICFRFCSFWDRVMILCLLCPMMGRQEAHLRIRYVLAVGYLDEMYPSFIVFDMKLERACALDV
jgi:hypothetical protein